MSSRSETDYFIRREREERARAETCNDVAARRVHLDMAQRYRERAQIVAAPATASIAA